MARQVMLSDDFDGSAPAETIEFSLDGKKYEVDLNAEHANTFREFVQRFIDAGRAAKGRKQQSNRGKSSEEWNKIREWARANGYELSDRGRVAGNIVDAYYEAHPDERPDEEHENKTNGDAAQVSESVPSVSDIPTLA